MWPTDMLTSMLQFAVVAGVMTLVPGLDFTLILRTALTQTKRVSFAAGLGISLGLVAWALAAAAGLSALLAASDLAFTVMRFVGAAYMIYLGARFLWHSRNAEVAFSAHLSAAESGWTGFRRGVLTNVLNPKIGVFYIAILPPFIPADSNVISAALLLGSVHVIESMLYFTAIILAAGFFKAQFERPRLRAAIDRVAGILILGFGLKLLTAGTPAS
jgi:threonine/homoserine/homoserine lactone efflux protein